MTKQEIFQLAGCRADNLIFETTTIESFVHLNWIKTESSMAKSLYNPWIYTYLHDDWDIYCGSSLWLLVRLWLKPLILHSSLSFSNLQIPFLKVYVIILGYYVDILTLYLSWKTFESLFEKFVKLTTSQFSSRWIVV